MARKMSTTERHAKQKAKLQAEGVIQKQSTYVPEPSLKEKALAEATKNKMNAFLVSQVLYFYVDSMDELDKIKEWLSEKYGNPIPFSFGVKVGKPKGGELAFSSARYGEDISSAEKEE